MIKCMILDFDGLIIDTETSEIESFEKLYDTYQVEFPVEKWMEGIGSALKFDPYEPLSVTGVKREKLRKQRAQLFESLIKDKSTRAGVKKYLIRAKELGMNIALASSSSKSWIDQHMEQLDIRQYFDFICTADDVEHVKPEPDLYLKVLNHFNIRSDEAVVFEDSPNGALAAIRAGIRCVAVPNPTTESMKFDPGIVLRLTSKEEMSLDEVLSRL
ncbi:HAD-IA family hydrolase [Jeotgalibacillus haloalkalitolerans]|uniref:HAD-IA family hydrolase n=1 Tax=Jeotgalibacillus haloalkalitolerans TaxID=3104292 RepID=A0ABU5KND2_9BACL|nr:HAD-IA family hydrolase [Jeotgalibacillus sp. HH7-29]MDZ5712774.1 HAD-IA family hydrolase [Jeotgalibacillus sp. HH7-29]